MDLFLLFMIIPFILTVITFMTRHFDGDMIFPLVGLLILGIVIFVIVNILNQFQQISCASRLYQNTTQCQSTTPTTTTSPQQPTQTPSQTPSQPIYTGLVAFVVLVLLAMGYVVYTHEKKQTKKPTGN